MADEAFAIVACSNDNPVPRRATMHTVATPAMAAMPASESRAI